MQTKTESTITIEATVIRKDGKIEKLGVIADSKSNKKGLK
jgi:hypothetical protein